MKRIIFFAGMVSLSLIIRDNYFTLNPLNSLSVRRIRVVKNPGEILISSPWGDLIGKTNPSYRDLRKRVKMGIPVIVGMKKKIKTEEVEYVKVDAIYPRPQKSEDDIIIVYWMENGNEHMGRLTTDEFLMLWDRTQYWTEKLLNRPGGIVPLELKPELRWGEVSRPIEGLSTEIGLVYHLSFSVKGKAGLCFLLDRYDTQRLLKGQKLWFDMSVILNTQSPAKIWLEVWDGLKAVAKVDLKDNVSMGLEIKKTVTLSLSSLKPENLEIKFFIAPMEEGQSISGCFLIKVPIKIEFKD